MDSKSDRDKYYDSKGVLRGKIITNLKCPICKCLLFGGAPYIHDCKIKNLQQYQKSRFLDTLLLESVMNHFNYTTIEKPVDKNEIKKIDKLIQSGSPIEAKQTIINENRISTELDLVIDLYTGKLNGESVLYFGPIEVNTIFTNEEVIHLAFGVKEDKVSRLARKYLNGKRLENTEWVFLHKTMMNGVKEFGKDYLLQLLDLNKVDITTTHQVAIFNMLQKLSGVVKNPAIRLEYNGMTYVCEFVTQNEQLDRSIIQISQSNPNFLSKQIFRINKNGLIVALPENGIFPTFQLIQAFCLRTKALIIGYGLKEGRCSICNKPLTDNESKRKGIGPVCEKNIGLY